MRADAGGNAGLAQRKKKHECDNRTKAGEAFRGIHFTVPVPGVHYLFQARNRPMIVATS
jgi:hypothetical protein